MATHVGKQREHSVSSPPTPTATGMELRRRKFSSNPRWGRGFKDTLRKRDDDEDGDEDDEELPDSLKAVEVDDDDDDDESFTKTATATTTSPLKTSGVVTQVPVIKSAVVTLASTSSKNQNPPLTTIPLPTTLPNTLSAGSNTPSTSVAKTSFSAASHLDSTSAISSQKSTFTLSPTTKPSTLPSTTGLPQSTSGAKETLSSPIAQKTHMPPGEIAGVVFGVMGAVLFVLFIIIWYVRRHHRRSQPGYVDEKPTRRFSSLASLSAWRSTRQERGSEGEMESRLWGGGTSYGTRTEVDIPAYVPASMQPGGQHDPSMPRSQLPTQQFNPTSRNHILSQSSQGTIPVFPPPPVARTGEMRNGMLRVPSRWFTRESVMSVSRFRDIKSWAVDQRERVASSNSKGSSLGTSIGRGSADSRTGIPRALIPGTGGSPGGRYSQLDD